MVNKEKSNIFVVTHKLYTYGEEVYDYKDMMLNPVSVKGVFSTHEKAEEFIKESIKKDADWLYGDDLEDEDPDTELKEKSMERDYYHWSVHELVLDKTDYK